ARDRNFDRQSFLGTDCDEGQYLSLRTEKWAMAIQNATIDCGSGPGYGPGLALAFLTSHGLLAAAETTSESESSDHEAKLVSTVWDKTSSGVCRQGRGNLR
ncbi:hypothetical protein E4U35_006909, partial [Claviceps purpurea]